MRAWQRCRAHLTCWLLGGETTKVFARASTQPRRTTAGRGFFGCQFLVHLCATLPFWSSRLNLGCFVEPALAWSSFGAHNSVHVTYVTDHNNETIDHDVHVPNAV